MVDIVNGNIYWYVPTATCKLHPPAMVSGFGLWFDGIKEEIPLFRLLCEFSAMFDVIRKSTRYDACY